LDQNDGDSKQKTKENAIGNQGNWSHLLHGDLDPHERGTPNGTQQQKDEPMFWFQE
jgi:hypothetical protein